MKRKAPAKTSESASERITARIVDLDDWRGETLTRVRALLHEVDPEIVEEWKWRGTPVWSHGGIVCTGESYKSVVKLTFAKGASLPDPKKLFNSSLEGNARRAIDIRENEKLDTKALGALFRAAIALNVGGKKTAATNVAKKSSASSSKTAKKTAATKKAPATKNAAPKSATKNAAPKKAAPKTATKKAAPKTATKKAAPKTATKKAAPKKAAPKSATKKAARK